MSRQNLPSPRVLEAAISATRSARQPSPAPTAEARLMAELPVPPGHLGQRCPLVPSCPPGLPALWLTATCVCGSDLWAYRGQDQIDGPAPMGHEYAGVVEEIGSDVIHQPAA